MEREAHLQRCEVDYTVNLGMLLKDLVQTLLVHNVHIVVCRLLAANELDSVEHLRGRVVEVVDNHDFVSGFEECEDGEGTDVAGATATE